MGRAFQTRLLISIVAFCFAITANAKIIRYTLDNVTFADGGTASGYFEWGFKVGALQLGVGQTAGLAARVAIAPV